MPHVYTNWGYRKPAEFEVLYIDPPWAYNQRAVHTGSTKFGGGVHGQYPVIQHHEMLYIASQIKHVMNENAIMFIWIVNPQVKEALEFIEAAGFKYKTKAFTWIKLNPRLGTPFVGPGYYTGSNSEDCWLAVRGKPPAPDVRLISQVLLEPRDRHSKKPYAARERIEKMYPEARKLEMFARETHMNWASMGNEIDGLDIRDALKLAKTGYYDIDSTSDSVRELIEKVGLV